MYAAPALPVPPAYALPGTPTTIDDSIVDDDMDSTFMLESELDADAIHVNAMLRSLNSGTWLTLIPQRWPAKVVA